MSYFDPTTWRSFNKEEMLALLDKAKKRSHRKKGRKKKKERKGSLVLQRTVSPYDVYTYLHARFGQPNGLQTFLAKDDSDNLFHWDYHIRAGNSDLMLVGATEEVHVWFDEQLDDAACWQFINALKADFARIAREKGRFAGTLEKWSIFPNQYLSIANRCAELHDTIAKALPRIDQIVAARDLNELELLTSERRRKSHSKLMAAITAAPTELSVLMPVMFESFIGLLVAGLIKPEVKRDRDAFTAFVRSPLLQKLTSMATHCNGFERAILQTNPALGRYWSVVNKRNDILHGNVDPVKNALEVVYFHGKRPLYKTGGDRLLQHWVRLVAQYKPQDVLDDYIAMHEFIIEILNHLAPPVRRTIQMVMMDTQPGWDNKRKIFGRLFPDHVATSMFEGLRYDWQLKPEAVE